MNEFPHTPRQRLLRRLALGALLGISLAQALFMQSGGRVNNNDFKHIWLGSRLLADGLDPYDRETIRLGARAEGFDRVNPFVYLPATGLMLRPVSVLPFAAAALVWFWINWFLAWLCAICAPIYLRVERTWLAQFAAGAFLVGSLPFFRQMTAGQMNVVVLASLILSLGLLIRRRDGLAGIVIGLAAAFKIAPFFLLVVLAGMRRWKSAAVGFLALVVTSVLADLWAGWEVHQSALVVLRQMGYGSSTWSELGNDFYRDPFNQSVNSLFHHLLTKNPYTEPWLDLGAVAANVATYAVSLAMLFTLIGILIRYRRRPHFRGDWSEEESENYLIGVLLMLLLPSLMWDHYAVQAVVVLIWVFGSRRVTLRSVKLVLALGSFLALAYPIVHPAEPHTHGLGILMMSLRLWGTMGLLLLVGSPMRSSE